MIVSQCCRAPQRIKNIGGIRISDPQYNRPPLCSRNAGNFVMLRIFVLCLLMGCVLAVPGNYGGADCTPTSSAPASNPTDANYQQKLGWFIRFADAFMYPNNTIEASKINSTLFADNVQGRVDLTSTFDGRELNTEVCYLELPSSRDITDMEYIFGLFSTIA